MSYNLKHTYLSMVCAAIIVFFFIGIAKSNELEWADKANLGGNFSVYSYGQAPYNRAAPFLALQERQLFSAGAEAFSENRFHDGDQSVGVVPTLSANAPSCESCHFKDGRGRTHTDNRFNLGFSVVNDIRERDQHIFRYPFSQSEKTRRLTDIRWRVADTITLSGGELVELVEPVAFVDGKEQRVDLRNAPAIYGLGLLEAVSTSSIRARAKARKFAMFGVEGQLPIIEKSEDDAVGRFGWKGTFATLSKQTRHAMKVELGIDVMSAETIDPGIEKLAKKLIHYMRFLAVPARRLSEASTQHRGAKIFASNGCVMCHQPSWKISPRPNINMKFRDQIIYPFTDFLLHDLGDKLASPGNVPRARLWQTPPLWGIGVQHSVSNDAGFLHDGRARTFTEAILWHGGEASHSISNFTNLTSDDRRALIDFLSSL